MVRAGSLFVLVMVRSLLSRSRGYMLQYAVDQAIAGNWQPGYKAFGLAMGPQASGMVVCNAPAAVKEKLLETEKAIREGKIKTLEG